MYTEETSTGKYAIQDVTRSELEMLIEGLIVLKTEKFADHENFVFEREKAVRMYHSMNIELAKTPA